jgi:hypothetical protein
MSFDVSLLWMHQHPIAMVLHHQAETDFWDPLLTFVFPPGRDDHDCLYPSWFSSRLREKARRAFLEKMNLKETAAARVPRLTRSTCGSPPPRPHHFCSANGFSNTFKQNATTNKRENMKIGSQCPPLTSLELQRQFHFIKKKMSTTATTALPTPDRPPVDSLLSPHTSSKCWYLLFNFVSSVVITFINDAIFSRAEFGYPAWLCLNGFVATYLGCELMRWFSLVKPIQHQKPLMFEPNFALLVLVVGMSKTLNNASLKHNSMGFYQIFKLLVTPLVVLLEYCLDGRMLSSQRLFWLGCVCLFVLLSIRGDLQFSVVGAMWATIWVPFAALYKIQWSRVRKMYGCSTLSLMDAVMPYAIIFQLFLAPIVDPPGIRDYHWTAEARMLVALSGLATFFVIFSGFLVIGNVNPLAHTLLSPMKTGCAMIFATLLYNVEYTTKQLFGAFGALITLAIYTHATITEREEGLLHPSSSQYHLVSTLHNQHPTLHHHDSGVIKPDDLEVVKSVSRNSEDESSHIC